MQGVKTDLELSHKTYVNVVKPRRRFSKSATRPKCFLFLSLLWTLSHPVEKVKTCNKDKLCRIMRMKSWSVTIQTIATEQILSYGSFSIMMFKVVLTFELWASSFKCDHKSESYWAVLYKGVDHFCWVWKRYALVFPFFKSVYKVFCLLFNYYSTLPLFGMLCNTVRPK